MNIFISNNAGTNRSYTDYQYNDPLKRLTKIINSISSGTVDSHEFTYNNLDLIGTETIETGTPLDSFTAGLTTYDYNNLNQLLNSTNPNQSFTYDDDGNMTQGYTPEGYVMTMTYDAENRLKTAEYTGSGGIIHRTEYFYSGDSLLAEVKKYDNGALINDTRFVRVGFLPIQERDGNNAVTREYTWGLNLGGGIGGLLNLKYNAQDYAYLYDGKGNVSALINSNQQVVASYRYDEFGKPLKKIASLDQPYRFSTKQYDEPTGLSIFDFRFYYPATGKWMTRDPIGEKGDINLYRAMRNNQVNYIDPWGLYGSGSCGYYDQACAANNYWYQYECSMSPTFCMAAPTGDDFLGIGNWGDCVRQCLQEKHRDRMPDKDRYSGVPGEDVRIYAMDALSEIGDIKNLDVLKSYLKESRRERIVAAGTIIKILMRSKVAK